KKPPWQRLKPPEAAVLLLHLPSRGIPVYRSDGCAFSYHFYVDALVCPNALAGGLCLCPLVFVSYSSETCAYIST
ncbi:hypothetical protein Tco_1450627, partial [Tanacetum coccineum]